MTRDKLKRFTDYLEYLLILVAILECNSMYVHTTLTATDVDMTTLMRWLGVFLSAGLLLIHGWRDRGALKGLAGYGVALAGLIAYSAAFYALNVRYQDVWRQREYLTHFLLILPMLAALFKLKQREGRPFDLLHKHSDILCAIAAMSLVVYLASVVRPDSVPADAIYTRWSNGNRLKSQINLLEVCQSVYGSKWQLFGASLLRNRSVFTEPPMFSLQLFMALYTELFLRDEGDPGRVWRRLVLSAALVTVSATLGLMLAALGWGIKGAAVCWKRRRRWLIVPILLAAVLAVGALYLEKDKLTYEDTDVSSSSISDHIDDYRTSLKAFSTQPLTGGGYQAEEFIRGFMSARRLETNPGLSNSAAVILAEGGVMLGALCMLPFGICLLYFLRRRDRRVACWGVGALSAYVCVIFHFHLYFMMLLAFGYSLVEVNVGGRGRAPVRLALADTRPGAGRADIAPSKRKRLALAVAGVALCAALIGFGRPVWVALHDFLRSHQFSLAQSPLRALCFAAALLLHGATARDLLRGDASWRRAAVLLVWDAVYLLAYPLLFSGANTLLRLNGLWGNKIECFLLLGLYMAPAAFVLLCAPKRWLGRRGVLLAGAIAAAACAAFFVGRAQLDGFDAAQDPLMPALEELAQAASGKVYVDELPLLYRRRVPGVSLTSTRAMGYEIEKNASVVLPRGTDRKEMFDAGFEVAELTEDWLLYTNDAAVIDALSARGVAFNRYYPFEKPVDLNWLGFRNQLTVPEDGVVLVEGPLNSLNEGPGDVLLTGQYTVRWRLHADVLTEAAPSPDAVVCCLRVSCKDGEKNLALKDVTVADLDESGNAEIELPFKVTALTEGVEYRLLGGDGFMIEVREIALRQTPVYITVATYNSHRDPIRLEYYGLDALPYTQANGSAAVERDYDLSDQVVAVRYYDAQNRPVLMNGDYFEVKYRLNSRGERIRLDYFGVTGAPEMVRKGYASMEREFDAYGNITVYRYYDLNNQPVLTTAGYAELRYSYDDKKRVIREEYRDVDGTLKEGPEGFAGFEQSYDEADNVSSRRFFDRTGEPALRAEGYAEVRWQYNALKQIVREAFFGLDGEPIAIASGQAANEREYDDMGNIAVQRYYDTANAPTVIKSGYAQRRRVYNAKKQVIREAYFDVDGSPMAQSGGYSAIEQEYDAAGNVSVRRFYGADGKPYTRSEGYAGIRWQYNAKKQIIREEHCGPDGAPVMLESGYSIDEREYDSAGSVAVWRYYDTAGEPVVTAKGYAQLHLTRNAKKQITREMYFGADGLPIAQAQGHFGLEMEYDDAGNVAVRRYLDGDGQPMAICEGYAEIRRAFDGEKRVVREAYFDAQGEPCLRAAGYAAIEQEYDGDGKLALRRYLDPRGDAALRTDGYSQARWTTDESGVRSVSFQDADGDAVPADGLNLVLDAPDGWSRWYTPGADREAVSFVIGSANLGEKAEGDAFACQIEIEFSGVSATPGKAFLFRTEGATDGVWNVGNVWNSRLVNLTQAPEDGVYAFTAVRTLSGEMAGLSRFNIGFRCDYWAGGSFRVRRVKVERGARAGAWTPGL